MTFFKIQATRSHFLYLTLNNTCEHTMRTTASTIHVGCCYLSVGCTLRKWHCTSTNKHNKLGKIEIKTEKEGFEEIEYLNKLLHYISRTINFNLSEVLNVNTFLAIFSDLQTPKFWYVGIILRHRYFVKWKKMHI